MKKKEKNLINADTSALFTTAVPTVISLFSMVPNFAKWGLSQGMKSPPQDLFTSLFWIPLYLIFIMLGIFVIKQLKRLERLKINNQVKKWLLYCILIISLIFIGYLTFVKRLDIGKFLIYTSFITLFCSILPLYTGCLYEQIKNKNWDSGCIFLICFYNLIYFITIPFLIGNITAILRT